MKPNDLPPPRLALIPRIVEFTPEIQQLRRDIHAHPELRFEEERTADIVARLLEGWGYAVKRGLGKTGVVGTLKCGTSSRAIGLRADMDALPIQEHNTFAHASRHAGRMHACGHDGHTAMLLAAARYLAETRAFDGTVHVIFQPAEEGGAGAKAMIDDGLFTHAPCDAVFGMHNWPGMPVGVFGLRPGPMMASSNEFEIRVIGKGAHAAMPHLGVDPVMVACQIAQGLQLLISREKKPVDTAVLSVTQIIAGDALNVIPDDAVLKGTVRTFTLEVLDQIEAGMRRVAANIGAAFNARVEVDFKRNYPPTVNHAKETEFAARVMDTIVGPENVVRDREPTMGAEDFSFMLLEKPGCYVFIGNGEGDHRDAGHGMGPCMLHNPSYDFNDALIPLGATYWVKLAETFLCST
ncbi:MAG TPA: M20 aminoacylase family protein [Burkholderiaceae bacterium]|nr:M20 aminoacylase family protein [Burkholderiaceae bacterium]